MHGYPWAQEPLTAFVVLALGKPSLGRLQLAGRPVAKPPREPAAMWSIEVSVIVEAALVRPAQEHSARSARRRPAPGELMCCDIWWRPSSVRCQGRTRSPVRAPTGISRPNPSLSASSAALEAGVGNRLLGRERRERGQCPGSIRRAGASGIGQAGRRVCAVGAGVQHEDGERCEGGGAVQPGR